MIVVVITEETTESLLELLFLIDSSISLWEKKNQRSIPQL